MITIGLQDGSFAHSTSWGSGDFPFVSDFLKWDRENEQDITVFTDGHFEKAKDFQCKIKIALILEPPIVSLHSYNQIVALENDFDYIFTYFQPLLDRGPKYRFYPFGGCWIKPEDRDPLLVERKTKLCSIIASHKNFTPGHQLRHQVVRECFLGNPYLHNDIYGNGYRFIPYKLEALADYKYSVVIENCAIDNFFTEKLIDSFITCTIPIYYGAPNIGDYFNLDGVIQVNNIDEVKTALLYANDNLYESRKEAIMDNFSRALKYALPEDWLYFNFFKDFD